jgi:serine/threonine protein kinase
MNNTIGGQVIASGGFGCVFSPELKCKGKKTRGKNRISKLMIEKYTLAEYNEIKTIREKINKIPNYEFFFLLNDFNVCKPAKLSKSDLKEFNHKCTALPKNKITSENINDSLDKMLALNMPNGGIPVDDFIYDNSSYDNIIKLNNCLINLLIKGIVPMNHKNIYHCDIKDSNILVDQSNSHIKTRLIDWGLSTEYIPNINQKFPKTWRNRPLQFNVPFSVIIFSDIFVDKYIKYIENGGKIEYNSLKPFVLNYISIWMKERGSGHYKYINNIMTMLFNSDIKYNNNSFNKSIENDFTLPYISNYIIEILINFTHFTPNGTLNLRIYLDTVFIKIVDIWGLIISYLPIFEILFENYNKLNDMEKKLFESLKQIFIKYLYNPRIVPINITELTNELSKLNKLIKTGLNNKKLSNSSHLKTSTSKKMRGVTGNTYTYKSFQKMRSKLSKSFTKKNKKSLNKFTQNN